MMRSATDFLPPNITTFMNLAISSLPYFGSGSITRLGISLRRGISTILYALLKRLLVSLHRTWNGFAYGLSRQRYPGYRAPRGNARQAGPSHGHRGSTPPSAPAGCGLHHLYNQ